ncbi:MAG TPA: hypothetical protein VND98_10220 [Solirubrobacterales bacterium]|nr:hypothetical protein [Solirubrobacterales bacterium]
MATAHLGDRIRRGRVHGRYFRENFAQGGLDLSQILIELITNSDAAIAATGRDSGRIELYVGPPDPEQKERWKRESRALGLPAQRPWRTEIRCSDDGIGVNAKQVDARLGVLGGLPEDERQRGLFGRGLRDVWLAQGAGRIEGIRDGHAVESWFLPSAGDDPYLYVHVLDEADGPRARRVLGLEQGARVTVPLTEARPPGAARLRNLVSNLVQLRPVLEDPSRELWLELPGETPGLVLHFAPEPDPERPLLLDETVKIASGIEAQIVVRRAAAPIPLSPSRALRRGGLLIRSGRTTHETTLGSYEGRPGARHLFGEVVCEGIERLQRKALYSSQPQVLVKVDRSGLNENHPVIRDLRAAIDRALRPIVEAEEKRAESGTVRPGRELRARDQVGLRALNDVLRSAFDAPGSAGFGRGTNASERAPLPDPESDPEPPSANGGPPGRGETMSLEAAMRFKQSPLRLRPGEQRSFSILFDPMRVAAGAEVSLKSEPGITARFRGAHRVPEPSKQGWARVAGRVRALASAEPGSRLTVTAEAAGHSAELEVLIVRHRASGWVREIARKDVDSQIEAEFDPESGVVTVYEGRREFRALERAARRAGLPRRRGREYLPYRMLEVEVAANAVYAWAAERVLERRFAESLPSDPARYAAAVRLEAQALRHRAHEKLMRAFLDPAVFEGTSAPPERLNRG